MPVPLVGAALDAAETRYTGYRDETTSARLVPVSDASNVSVKVMETKAGEAVTGTSAVATSTIDCGTPVFAAAVQSCRMMLVAAVEPTRETATAAAVSAKRPGPHVGSVSLRVKAMA